MQDHSPQEDIHRKDGYDVDGSIATYVANGFTMVAVGVILSRPLTNSYSPGFSHIVAILRNADVLATWK